MNAGPFRYFGCAKLGGLLATVLLCACTWGGDPCAGSSRFRPGWDEKSMRAEVPYLSRPKRPGCGAKEEGPLLGCPRLVNGEEPLRANFDRARPPSMGHYRVYLLTSPDLQTFTLRPDPVLIAFSSLGLLLEGEYLYLFGSTQIPVFTPHAVVTAVRTKDLEHFEGCAWNICQEPVKGLVDTQPAYMADGSKRLWYYSVPNPPDGKFSDPASLKGPHSMVFADYLDGVFYARGVSLADERLADPDVVAFRGKYLMAVSQDAHRVLIATSTDGESFVFDGPRLESVSVPHLTVIDEQLLLVVQRFEGGAGPWPVLYVSSDGIRFAERGLLSQGKPEGGCTSPVLTRFLKQYVLFCASFVPGAPRP